MNICVFTSAQDLDEKYVVPAVELARLIGERGHGFVWGGSKNGLMGQTANAAKAAGAKLYGFSLARFREVQYMEAHELRELKTLAERKVAMLENSDAFVATPGGIGTLDELTEILELIKHGAITKKLALLNTDSFYEGLYMQLERMEAEGFLPLPFKEIVYFADTPEDVLQYLEGSTVRLP